jgi:hypothetical protein
MYSGRSARGMLPGISPTSCEGNLNDECVRIALEAVFVTDAVIHMGVLCLAA